MRMSSMHHRAHDSVVVVPEAAGSSPVGLLLRSGVAITPTRAFSSATAVLTPGVYCNGISISGGSSNVTFMPGTYILMSPRRTPWADSRRAQALDVGGA